MLFTTVYKASNTTTILLETKLEQYSINIKKSKIAMYCSILMMSSGGLPADCLCPTIRQLQGVGLGKDQNRLFST